MIFASVGSMLPFDRFVRLIDEWAMKNTDQEVFIQIGDGAYEPRHAAFARTIPLAEYRSRLAACDLFVAHVGIGSILQGLEAQKQMLLMPRDIALGEHTTDHQMHTAARFVHRKGLRIVFTVEELAAGMSELLRSPLPTGDEFSTQASPELISSVGSFLRGGTPAPNG